MAPETNSIRHFFKDQTIFITGGTGFVGKVLIEKLLRECSDLRRIYILVRPKKGKTSEERVEAIFDYPCFDVLKSKNVDYVDKVVLVNGNCYEEFLGLSDADIEMLKTETTCVIHAAASVKFDQSLKEASCYVRATRDVLLMAKEMPKLKTLVYVSTAFSNCLNSRIKEDFYTPPLKADDFLAMVNVLDDDVLQNITPHLLGKWPNSYIYTKCISESLVQTLGEGLPVSIVRPAIISGSINEPVSGWIDNFYGVIGVVLAASLGVLRSLHAKKSARAAIVPVDYVSNVILAAAAHPPQSATIYNFAGHEANTITWAQFMKLIESHAYRAATVKVVWLYGFELRENKLWHNICFFFMHTVVAHVVDFILKCMGKPPFAVENCRRLNKSLKLLSFFTVREWIFEQENLYSLNEKMTVEDKKTFYFMMDRTDWNDWGVKCIFGGRKYLLKDTIDTIPKGIRKARFLFFAHYTIVGLLYYILYKLILLVVRLFF